jgi:hypothetical protein
MKDFAGDFGSNFESRPNPAHASGVISPERQNVGRETQSPGNNADGPRGHAADAGVPSADARRNAEKAAEEEITPEMITAGLAALESELCEDCLTDRSKTLAVRKIWAAMKMVD